MGIAAGVVFAEVVDGEMRRKSPTMLLPVLKLKHWGKQQKTFPSSSVLKSSLLLIMVLVLIVGLLVSCWSDV